MPVVLYAKIGDRKICDGNWWRQWQTENWTWSAKSIFFFVENNQMAIESLVGQESEWRYKIKRKIANLTLLAGVAYSRWSRYINSSKNLKIFRMNAIGCMIFTWQIGFFWYGRLFMSLRRTISELEENVKCVQERVGRTTSPNCTSKQGHEHSWNANPFFLSSKQFFSSSFLPLNAHAHTPPPPTQQEFCSKLCGLLSFDYTWTRTTARRQRQQQFFFFVNIFHRWRWRKAKLLRQLPHI